MPSLTAVSYTHLDVYKRQAYGTGMGKIMKAYEGMEEKPLIETTKNAFKIILPNINAKYEMRNDSAFRCV